MTLLEQYFDCMRAGDCVALADLFHPEGILHDSSWTRVGEDIWRRAEEDSLRGLFLQELRRQYDAAGDDSTRERIVRAVRFGLAAMDGRDL